MVPDTSYLQLRVPDIADRIGLTDEQRARVNAVLVERGTALAAAAGDSKARLKAEKECEQKLAEILTPEQRAEWADKVVQRTIQFNFRFQLWADVLEWFAEEADLALVMNNPPPGTFNYTDPRRYTPEEAIDLLNGVLLTHGFTLIRRDKMLIVQDLSRGLPQELIPSVEMDDLNKRGDSELVKVRFPLGKRDAAAVIAEITPIKGVYGQIIPLPTTAQLVITDTASNVRTMAALIEAIPEPKPPVKPPEPPKPPTPPAPELVVYPITKADPGAVQEILTKMIPSITMEFDANRGQLYVYTTPNYHTTVAKVLESMEAELPAERQRTLEIYSIKESAQPVAVATPTAPPGAEPAVGRHRSLYDEDDEDIVYDSRGRPRYRIDAYGRRIPISARYRAELERAAEGPAAAAAATASKTETTTPATVTASDSILDILQKMVPGAELHLDRANARLMAFATAEEHKVIKEVIEKRGGSATADELPVVEVYTITHSDPDSLKTMFESLFPGVQINIDKATSSMVVFAYPSEHTSIKETLDRLMPPPVDGTTPVIATATELRFYPLKDNYPITLQTVLAGLVPNALVTYDTYNSRLIVVGSATDHELIARGVEQLEKAKAEDRSKLVVYPVTPLQKTRFTSVLQSLVSELPGVVVLPDARPGELAIWTTAIHHEAIAGILKQFEGEGSPAEGEFKMVAYPVKAIDPADVQEMLEDLFPNVRMLVDRKASKLLVWATAAEQTQIENSIADIVSEPPPEEQPRFETYTIRSLAKRSATTLRVFENHLEDLVPNAQLTLDVTSGELIVWGTPEEQSLVRTAIERLGHGNTPENTPSLKVYPLDDLDPTTAQTLLTRLVRDAELSLDTKANKLIVMAVPADQEMVQKTLEELAASDSPENKAEVRFHTLKEASSTEVISVLREIVPKADVKVDAKTGRLTVVAKPEDQEKVAAAIAKIEEASADKAELRFLPIKEELPADVMKLLATLAPKAQITADTANDRLMVIATPEDHQKIADTLAKVEEAGTTEEELRFHDLEEKLPANVLKLLAEVAPKAQITEDTQNDRLMVWATAEDQEKIAATLAKVVEAGAAKPELRFHELLEPLPPTVLKLLAELAPKAEITPDTANDRLMVMASEEDHKKIEETIAKVEKAGSTKPELRFYPTEEELPAAVLSILKTLAPKAQITPDSSKKYLTVVATPADHEVIKSTLEQATTTLPAEEKEKLVVYAVTAQQQTRFQSVLASVKAELPSVKVIPDTTPGQLSIWGKPSEHEVLSGIFDELNQEIPPEEKFQLVAYPLKSADPTSITKVLGELFPSTRITLDAASNRLLIWTRPEEHEAIRRAIEQVDAEGPPEEQRRFEVYAINGVAGLSAAGRAAKAAGFLANLQSLVPNAKLTIDSETGNLVAFATPSEHEIIRTAVEKLGKFTSAAYTPQLEVHELTTADPKTTIPILEGLVPRAEITLDSANNRLIVLAPPDSQMAIRNTLAQLQSNDPGANDPQVRVINLKTKASQALTDVLEQLAPKANVTIDEDGKRLVVVATEADHEIVARTVEQIDGALGEDEENALMVYPVTPGQRKRFEAVVEKLAEDLPDVDVIQDDEPTQVSVWAKPREHKVIGEILMQLKAGVTTDSQKRFEAYSIQGAVGYETSRSGRLTAASTLMTGLQELVPGSKLMIDSKNNKLVAWATPEEHEMLKAAVEKLAPASGEGGPQLVVYTLSKKAPAGLVDGLEKLVPEADVSIDTAGTALTVVATPVDQQMVKDAVDRLEQATSAKAQPYFEAYEIRGLSGSSPTAQYYSARTFMSSLEPLVPDARLSIDFGTKSLIAFGTAEEQAVLKAAIEKLTLAGPDNSPQLQVYMLKKRAPDNLLDGLRKLAPNAEISADSELKRFTVVANKADQEAIKTALDKIQSGGGEDGEPYFEIYAVTGLPASMDRTAGRGYSSSRYYAARSFADQLEPFAPNAEITVDYEKGNLLVLGTAKEHAAIKTAIEKLRDGGENSPELQIYSVQGDIPQSLMDSLTQLVPRAKITIDREARQISVVAVPADHAIVKETLDKIQTAVGEAKTELKVYEITSADMSTVQTVLTDRYPDIRIQLDAKNDRMFISALPEQHEGIAAAIKTMDSDVEGGSKEKTVAYAVQEVDAATAIRILQSLVSGMQFHADASGHQIVAFGRERDHKIVAEAIDQMEAGPDDAHKPYLMIYPMGDAEAGTLTQVLANLAPRANVVVDAENESLAVFAVKKDQETVRSAIESMAITAMGPGKPMAVTYTLKEIPVASATQILRLAVPQAQTAIGGDPQQLIVWANAKDQATVKTTLEAVDVEASDGSQQTAAVYALEGLNPRYSYYNLRLIREAVPKATMTLGADPTQMVVWATPKDHETIKELVKSLVEKPPELTPAMEIYTLEKVDALVAIKVLKGMVPDAELSVGSNAGQLVAWARPKDQETIKSALAKLTEADASPTAPTMEIYKLEAGDAVSATRLLAKVAPDAEVSVGDSADQLVVWARPSDHDKVKAAIAKIEAAGPKPLMKIYTLEKLEALSVTTMLKSIVPEAECSIGTDSRQLIVWATDEDQAEVANAIKEMSVETQDGKAPLAVTYPLNSLTAATAEKILKDIAPNAKYTVGDDEYQLIIWARPDEHAEIEKTLERIDLEGMGGGSEKAVIYELEGDTRQLYYISRFLQQVVTKARFVPGATPNQLVAWARPRDHEQIQELIDQLSDEENAPKAIVYDSGNVPAVTVTASLRRIVPEAVVTPGATPSQLVIWAAPKDHDKVKEVVDQLTAADSPDLLPTAVTYSLQYITTTTASQLLRLAVPQAQLSPGPERNQLIAWATPKDQDLIKKTLEKIDVEGPEDKATKLAVYQLKTTNTTQLYYISRFLQGAVPSATFTAGVVPGQVIAWALPKDHEKIADLIEQIEGEDGIGPVAEIYDLGDTTTTAVATVIRRIVPEAIATTGKTAYELVVWARPSEQEKVREIVEQMTAEAPPESAPKTVTYSLDGPSPTAVTTLMRRVVPQAIVSPGSDRHELVVWASPSDQEKVRELIDSLSAEGPPETQPSMETYALENIDALTVRTLLRSVTPEAQVSVGKDPQQLIVWARPHDHKLIAAALQSLSKEEPAETAPRMEIYTLESGDVLGAIRVLTPIVPEASLSAGNASDQMVVWARPKDHEKIKETIATLDASGAKPEMRTYPLKGIDSLNATRLLRSVAPEALCSVGTDRYELIIWARPNDHEKIKQSLDELAADDDPEKLPTAIVYSLEEVSTVAATQMLRLAVPQATVSPGAESYQLLIWARPDDHKKVEETLKQIDVPGPEDKQAKVVSYKLDGTTTTQSYYILRFLTQSVPTARFTMGVSPGQIIAWAQPKDHEEIADLIDQIQGGEENAPKPVVYELKNVTAASVLTMLRRVAPEASPTIGTNPYQLIVWARGEDHEKVKQLVDELSASESPETAPRAVTYTLEEITTASAIQMLRLAVPQAQVSPGAETYQLLIWARPDDHKKIEETLAQIDVPGPEDKEAKAVAYTLDGTTTAQNYYVLRFLAQSIPTARFTMGVAPDQIIAWAQPKVHEEISELIEQIQGGEENAPKPVVYNLKNASATVVTIMLRRMVPDAIASTGTDPYELVVWARGKDHEKIKKLVEELSTPEPPETAPVPANYVVEEITAATAMAILRSVVPQAQLSLGSDQYQFVALARPDDHELIKETLLKIDVDGPEDKQSKLVLYDLKNATAASAIAMVRQIAPRALTTIGANPYQLLVWARPDEHEDIQKAVDKLAAEDAPDKAFQAVTYTLEEVSTTTAIQILRLAVPQAQVNPGAETYQLVVWARPDDQKLVETTLAQIDVEGPEDKQAKAIAYTLDSSTTAQNYYILRFLAQSVPTARFTMGVAPDQIIAWAQPKDHEEIAELIEQVQGGEDNKPKAVAYGLKNVTASAVSVMLRRIVPEAVATLGTDPYQLVVWARPDDQEKVQQIIDELANADSPETAPRAVTYTLDEISAQSAMAMLRLAVPQAQLSIGGEPYQLIVWARPDDQVLVEQTLEQIDVKGPDEKMATVKIYELGIGDLRQMMYVLRFIQSAVPEARITMGSSAKQLVAWARPKDHEEIQKLVDEFAETPETTPRVVIYPLENTTAVSAIQLLATTFPLARFSVGSDPHQLIAWARGEDHEKIAEAVQELSKKESETTAPRMIVYPLESANVQQAMMILRQIVPEAQFGIGANTRQLIAWARPADHEIIKKAVEEMAKKEPEETAPRVQVYTVETVDARQAMSILATAVPEAMVSQGNDARQLVVFARPSEHEKVKTALDQLATKGPEELQPSIVIYTLPTEGAAHAMQVLMPVVPQAKFTLGADPSKLIVWAYPEDHEIIKSAVEQIEADSWLDGNRVMAVYPMKPEDVTTFMKLLEPSILQHAQFVPDVERECLIVWADKRYDEAIKRTIDEFHKVVPEIIEPTAVVYRFEKTDIYTAFRILQTLVPKARIAYDYRSASLVATALPEDHEKIRKTIEEMNRDAIEMAPRLQVHQITSADPARVLQVLTSLFRGQYNVQLSLDEANDALIAYATPLQHEKITELIAEIEKGAKLDTANQLKLYDLKNVDGYAAQSVLADMFQRQGVRVDLTVDRYRNQLIAMARPEQHEKIAEVLEQFRIPDRELEIFQLEYVELTTANLAIRRLFADESYLSQPEVDPDPSTGQLFVKASATQLEEIRKLLIRMGETNLVPAKKSSTGNLRVVPFKGDTKKVLEEIQKVWPNLRPNAIRVVKPGDLLPSASEELKPEKKPAPPKKEPSASKAKEGSAKPASPAKTEEKTKDKTGSVRRSAWVAPVALVSTSAGAPAPAEEDAEAPADAQPAEVSSEPAPEQAETELGPPPEVLIIAGEGSFTIASEDKEALNELESLLRTISARSGFASRDYSVFQIQNTSASQVAQTLQQLFRNRDSRTAGNANSSYSRYGYGYGTRASVPLIVADDRLNTILVKGTRADRQTIEGLLDILDTSEIAESVAAAYEPKMIAIKHTDANRVMQMIQTVYRSYFSSTPANSNFAPQVTVDDITNSLIIKAPPHIVDDITKFAQSLDKAADEDAAERLRVIPLKNANALRVQEMLNAMMRGGTGTYRSTPYRTTPYGRR